MNEAEALLRRAEAAGFDVKCESGLVMAASPASGDPRILQELAERVSEIRVLLLDRAAATRRSRLRENIVGCAAFMRENLQAGIVRDCDAAGTLQVKVRFSETGAASLEWKSDQVILISAAANARPGKIARSRTASERLLFLMRRCEELGARLWGENDFVFFGWPGQDPTRIPELLAAAIEEMGIWAARSGRVGGTAAEAICDEFAEFAGGDPKMIHSYAFQRYSATHRALAARLLQLGKKLTELRRVLLGDGDEVKRIDDTDPFARDGLAGSQAVLADFGTIVTIEGRDDQGFLIVSNEFRRRRIPPGELLVLIPDAKPAPRRSFLSR
ncbi:MAG TPA: hypothetical protein VKS20_10995 [Candidatus Acidoferrales bacterium]|nr:hypothetical protein [Candidatus Acidoferrales bacterium]